MWRQQGQWGVWCGGFVCVSWNMSSMVVQRSVPVKEMGKGVREGGSKCACECVLRGGHSTQFCGVLLLLLTLQLLSSQLATQRPMESSAASV